MKGHRKWHDALIDLISKHSGTTQLLKRFGIFPIEKIFHIEIKFVFHMTTVNLQLQNEYETKSFHDKTN